MVQISGDKSPTTLYMTFDLQVNKGESEQKG